MAKKLWSFVINFWRDGYALVGAITAPLSICFTLAKAIDAPALSHLLNISYAGAAGPLLL
jgi:hypothetical protein